MNLDRFLAQRSGDWAELHALLARSGSRGRRLSAVELRRLGTLYRSAAADLALARRLFPDDPGTVRLQGLVHSAYAVVYGRPRRTETVRTFLTMTMWQGIRSTGPMLALAAAIIVVFCALGALWALSDPAAASGMLPGGINPHPGHGGLVGVGVAVRPALAVTIFTNNIEVSFLALAGGFTLGLVTFYVLASNAAVLGVLTVLEAKDHQLGPLVRLVVPHGLLELSCIAASGAAGFVVTRALVAPGLQSRAQVLGAATPAIADCILGAAAGLVVAGLIEGIVTTWFLPLPAAVTVGVVVGVGFWLLVLFRGRRPVSCEVSPDAAPPGPVARTPATTPTIA